MLIKINGYVMGIAGELNETILSDKFLDFVDSNGWYFMGSVIEDANENLVKEDLDSNKIDSANDIEYLMSIQEKYYAQGDNINHSKCWDRINELLEQNI